MKGHKSLTIYKSRSCDLYVARAHGKGLEPEQGQGHAGAGPGLGQARTGPKLGWTSTVIVPSSF
jgi:hypothetical protein